MPSGPRGTRPGRPRGWRRRCGRPRAYAPAAVRSWRHPSTGTDCSDPLAQRRRPAIRASREPRREAVEEIVVADRRPASRLARTRAGTPRRTADPLRASRGPGRAGRASPGGHDRACHFLHVRSANPDAVPLILTHGWPGSIVEYLDLIEPLTGDFHLVIPSLPGYGFSGPTRGRGWNRYTTAKAWNELMSRLGYERFGVVGNDAGSMVGPEQGRLAPERVIGVHVTQLFSFPSRDPAEFQDLSAVDQRALAKLQWFYENKMSFNILQSQQPQTLAFALADSPAGLLAWLAQLFGENLDPDFVLANVAVYWFTRTAASSMRFYYEEAHATDRPQTPTTTPIGLAMFYGDFESIRRFADRDHANIVQWHAYGYPPLATEDPAGNPPLATEDPAGNAPLATEDPAGNPPLATEDPDSAALTTEDPADNAARATEDPAGDAASEPVNSNDAAGHYAAHEATEVLAADIRAFFNTLS
ncbi:alpha/beta fold hydrolase [Dactylosporangium sp. CA-139066]|uniref:alpha/beta fold hydrolase n=1 Tax=Dactylosporangium sp. CA-139066 TaxID=3239930 RepID=UPI003D942F91